MRRLFILALALSLPLTACAQRIQRSQIVPAPLSQPTPPPLLINIIDTVMVHAYTPPEIYAKWWKEIMHCTGLKAADSTRGKIRYVYVKAEAFTINNFPMPFIGYSFVRDNQFMVIFEGVTHESLIKHEMIHFLMYHNGLEAGHPDALFKRCKVV